MVRCFDVFIVILLILYQFFYLIYNFKVVTEVFDRGIMKKRQYSWMKRSAESTPYVSER